MGSGERVAAMPESIAQDRELTSCVHRQAEFDGLDEMLVYPGSAPATNLDNKLWLPDIVTYASATSSSSHLTPAACTLVTACTLHAGCIQPRYLYATCTGRYNSAQLERVTYENGAAWVKPSGRVHHSVAGLVDITCRHSRLCLTP